MVVTVLAIHGVLGEQNKLLLLGTGAVWQRTHAAP